MDPDETLKRALEIASTGVDSDEADLAALSELVIALDAWMRRAGFLPQRWQEGRKPYGNPNR